MDKATKKPKDGAVTTTAESGSATNRPIKTFRIDDVSCSIWARTVVKLEPKTYYSVTFERSYVGADGTRKYVKTFNWSDLPKLATLCKDAEQFIYDLQQQAEAAQEAA